MIIRTIILLFAFALAGCAGSGEAKKADDNAELTGDKTVDTAKEETAKATDKANTEATTEAEKEEVQLPQKETQMPDKNAPDDVAAPPENATTTESGLAYRIFEEGSGASPTETSTVRVHYTGWTTDGVKFDSSRDRGQPLEFPLDRVIAGWTEGVSLMKEGEKRRLWIPEELAYKGQPGRPAGMLVFDVELIKIVK